jgi:hypothetical protein
MALKGHEMRYVRNKPENTGPDIESPEHKIYRV